MRRETAATILRGDSGPQLVYILLQGTLLIRRDVCGFVQVLVNLLNAFRERQALNPGQMDGRIVGVELVCRLQLLVAGGAHRLNPKQLIPVVPGSRQAWVKLQGKLIGIRRIRQPSLAKTDLPHGGEQIGAGWIRHEAALRQLGSLTDLAFLQQAANLPGDCLQVMRVISGGREVELERFREVSLAKRRDGRISGWLLDGTVNLLRWQGDRHQTSPPSNNMAVPIFARNFIPIPSLEECQQMMQPGESCAI